MIVPALYDAIARWDWWFLVGQFVLWFGSLGLWLLFIWAVFF